MVLLSVAALLSDFFKQNVTLCLLHLLLYVFVPIRDILLPIQFTRLLDAIQKRQSCATVFRSLGLVVAIIVIVHLLDFTSDFIDTKLLPRLQSFVRHRALQNILDRHEDSIQDIETGELNTRLIKLPTVITSLFERVSIFVVPHIILHICVFVNMCINVDWFCAAYAAIATITVYIVTIATPYRCNDVAMKRDKAFAKLHEEIDDSMRNLYSIYGGNQQSNELQRLSRVADEYNELYGKTMLCSFRLRSLTYPVVTIFLLVFMLRVNHLSVSRVYSTPKIASLFLVGMILVNSFMGLDDQVKSVVYEMGVLQSNADLIPSKSERKKRIHHPVSLPSYYNAAIGMSNVQFSYPGSKDVILNNFDLHVHFGERLVIVGDVGSGKSTILKILMRYSPPSQGRVYFDGRYMDEIPTCEMRSSIAYVPQTPILFNRTVFENMVYGNPSKPSEQDVRDYLESSGLHFFLDKLHTKIGKNGSSLSGGQRQLLWCVRVMMSNPRVILMDEPTSSMDRNSKRLLFNMIQRLINANPSTTLIAVTHDSEFLSIASRIFDMTPDI